MHSSISRVLGAGAALALASASTVVAKVESSYFDKVEPIQWVDCNKNVPLAFAESQDLNSTTWPSKATPIPDNLKCGRLDVPVDYDKDFGNDNKVTIAFSVIKAKKPKGLLLYNPGGPAVEVQSTAWGVAFGEATGSKTSFHDLLNQDLVFMDTRGTGGSNQVKCDWDLFQQQPDSWFTTSSEFDEIKSFNLKFAQSCIDQTTPKGLIEHIGTDEVIRDWNSIRIGMGHDKFNYLGISYGTWFGAELAYDFAEYAGRVILDGVAAHGQPDEEQITTDLNAMNRLLLRSDAWCIANSTCPYNKQGKGAVPKVFKEQIQKSPQKFTQILRQKFRSLMTGNPQFSEFNEFMFEFEEESKNNFSNWENELRKRAAPAVTSTDLDNMAFQPIVCRDENVDDPTFEGFQKIMKETTGDDPDDLVQVAFNWGIKLGCVGWPIDARPKFTLPNKNSMMWVTSDFDLNTPTEQATTANKDTPNAVLVVRHGDNHGTWGDANQPAYITELTYLKNGVMPREVDEELVTVYGPGDKRDPIDDPYEVPVGEKAGDDDSVDSDEKEADDGSDKNYAKQNVLEAVQDPTDDGHRDLTNVVYGLAAGAGALLLLWLGTLIALIRARKRASRAQAGGASAFLANQGGYQPTRGMEEKAYPFKSAQAGHSYKDPYTKVATSEEEEEQRAMLAERH